jgi:hypothetical protein
VPDNLSLLDAHYKWLGIPPEEQPADRYRLLGLRAFESDADVIDAAADRQMAHVQRYQSGPHATLSQKILNEIATARVCLLNPPRKAAYDQSLRASLTAREQASMGAAATAPTARMIPTAAAGHRDSPAAPSPPVIATVRRVVKPRADRSASAWKIGAVVAAGVLGVVILVGVINALMNAGARTPVANSGDSPPFPPIPKPKPAGSEVAGASQTPAAPTTKTESQQESPAADSASASRVGGSKETQANSSLPPPSVSAPAEDEKSWRRGLVLALSMDRADVFEQQGKRLLRDHSGQENHAQLENLEFVEGQAGEAARFTMANQFLQCADTASLNPVDGLTLAAWIRADEWHQDFAQGSLLSKDDWDQRTTRGFVLRGGGNGKVDFTVGGSGWHGASITAGLATAQWHHLAGTYDGRLLRLYLDGSEEARSRIEHKLTPSPYPLRIGTGTFAKDRHFLGSIDEAAIWDRALTDEELAQILELSKEGKSYCR